MVRKLIFFICVFLHFTHSYAQEIGLATFYHDKFHHQKTASGELYNKEELSAAHRTFPFGSIIRITRLDTKKWAEARVTDRGPFTKGCVVDVSLLTAEVLQMRSSVKVRVDLVRLPDNTVVPLPDDYFSGIENTSNQKAARAVKISNRTESVVPIKAIKKVKEKKSIKKHKRKKRK